MSKYSLKKLESLLLNLLNEALVISRQQLQLSADVTFTQALLSNDRAVLKVYIDTLNRNEVAATAELLNKNVKIFRSYLAINSQTRTIPKIIFKVDDVIDNVIRLEEVINEINKRR